MALFLISTRKENFEMGKRRERKFEDKIRGREQRKRKPVVLLVAEGHNKTEKLYLEHFSYSGSKYTVKVLSRGETSPKGMLDEIKRERDIEEVLSENDIVGIILDLDCSDEKARILQDLMKKEEYRGLTVIASNPCFEVWFVAHFHNLQGTYTSSNQVLDDLRKNINNYGKGKDFYSKLKENTQTAIERCKIKTKQCGDQCWPSADCNPRTDVAPLVELLL